MKEESSEQDIWWGPVKKPMTPDVSFTSICMRAYIAHFAPCFFLVQIAGVLRALEAKLSWDVEIGMLRHKLKYLNNL